LHLGGGIKVILFDLDGTLRLSRPTSVQAFLEFAVRSGMEDGAEKRLRYMRWVHYYWAQSQEMLDDLETYPDSEDFWTNYARLSLLRFGSTEHRAFELAPEVQRYMTEEHRPVDYVPEDVSETLQALKDAGYRMGVVSNRRQPFDDELVELGLGGYFELALDASQAGSWKPEPGIFLVALERLGATPEQAVYVGDNYYADVIGAQRAGVQPVLYDPEGIFPDADCPVIRRIGELAVKYPPR
jgi:HAD superfamily hydrolase (TIGR01549 family)